MTPSVGGVYGGVPAAERRAERRARLMEAALDLYGTKGTAAVTVRAVCRAAGLSSRFFYESFTDLDALAVALFDDIVRDVTTAAVEAVAATPDDPRRQARAAVEALVHRFTADPRTSRFAFQEALGSEALMRRRLATMRAASRVLVAQAKTGYQPWPDDDTYVETVAAVLVGGFVELMVSWVRGELPTTREQLIDDYTTLVITTAENAAAIARGRTRGRTREPNTEPRGAGSPAPARPRITTRRADP